LITFSLVHGGQHGAWCFESLALALVRRGHAASAVDLPVEDPDAGASRYADVVVHSLASVGGDVVVVGHSMGGLVIPLVAQRRPVRGLVFLCGAIPEPGRSHIDVKRDEQGEAPNPSAASLWNGAGDRHMATAAVAREMFYNDCAPEVQDWAVAHLRPQCRRPLVEVTPLREWPDVPVGLVNASEDRCIPPAVAEHNAWRLFRRRPDFIRGGHLPFLSEPDLVADSLMRAAEEAWMEKMA